MPLNGDAGNPLGTARGEEGDDWEHRTSVHGAHPGPNGRGLTCDAPAGIESATAARTMVVNRKMSRFSGRRERARVGADCRP